MIFADKLIELRKKNGLTQEELAEKLNVSRQSVSKWEGAQSIPDLNKIIKLASIFNVSTDYLLKDEIEVMENVSIPADAIDEYKAENNEPVIRVSMEEATSFLDDRDKYSKVISIASVLCIMLGSIAVFSDGRGEKAELLSVVGILVLVAFAVGMFVYSGMQLNKYEYLEKENIDTEYGVFGMVKEKKESYKNLHNLKIVVGITLVILASVPIILGEAFFGDEGSKFLVFTLILVSIAVYNFITASMKMSGYNMLLEVEDYSTEKKLFRKKMGWVSGAYWMLMVAIYLGYSLMTNNWDKSWVIWPVAGVVFPIIISVLETVFKKR